MEELDRQVACGELTRFRTPPPSHYEVFVGGLSATIIAASYLFVPLYMIISVVLVVMEPTSLFAWLFISPIMLSAILPPISSKLFLQSWPFKYMPSYFQYEEYDEIPQDQIQQLFQKRHVLLCVQPHGVFSFGGACAGVRWSQTWWSPERTPTAVASSVMHFPIVKHIVGAFGMCNAASSSLTKQLTKTSVVLYIGGIAELFLSSTKDEVLFMKKRKGFIKLALRSGAEVCPVYFFGNTAVMQVARHPLLTRFARLTGMSLTWFWGLWGTPIPKPLKIVGVFGRPLGLPHIENPTNEEVDKYHNLYVNEVIRIFETYKVTNPDYATKTLKFEE